MDDNVRNVSYRSDRGWSDVKAKTDLITTTLHLQAAWPVMWRELSTYKIRNATLYCGGICEAGGAVIRDTANSVEVLDDPAEHRDVVFCRAGVMSRCPCGRQCV